MLSAAQKQIKRGSSPPLKLHRCEICDAREEPLRRAVHDLYAFAHMMENDFERDLGLTDADLKRVEGMIRKSVITLLDACDLVRFYERGGEA